MAEFRDCMGLPVTCASEEALRLYNEMLLVDISLWESALPLVRAVLELEPRFVLAHCVLGCMWLSDLVKPSDPKVSVHVEAAQRALEGGELTERERRHVQALLAYAEGDLPRATEHWVDILIRHPLDIQAIRVFFVSCVMLGEFEKMRNSLSGVLPHWSRDAPAYPFVLGFYAFSLEQTNYKDKAEEVAREALGLEKRNPWGIHALSHVIEESRPVETGVELLTSTRKDWASSILGGHLNWHLTLYYLGIQTGSFASEVTKSTGGSSSLPIRPVTMGYLKLSSFLRATDPQVSVHVEAAQRALEGGELTERERRHVQALLAYAGGDLPRATEHWTEILVRHPRDLLAIHMLFVSHKMLGRFDRMRDVIAVLLPHWERDSPAYPCLLGLYAFGLEETNYRGKAEEVAREALAMNQKTPFASHAMAHVLEETRPAEDGVQFLCSSRSDWSDTTYNNHLTWHLTLYHLELGDIAAVLREYDEVLAKAATPDNRLGMLDASSLLWRLNLMGVDTGDRWQRVTDSCTHHIGKHGSSWYDVHLMFSLCHGKLCEETARLALARQMMKSLEQYSKRDVSTECSIADKIGVPCCNALLAYGQERYDEVVSLLVPLRYDLLRLGGSWAQRQVFNLTMIQAAVKAGDVPMAMALVSELKAQKPHCHSLALLFDSLMTAHRVAPGSPSQPALLPPDSKRQRLA